ncbi:hypothetical protein Acsp04_18560 [Actinomadura sp. NBRC 104425]|uniref:hypothetical protein n=1 Tax=Actinomadura sp. NBRC 104425 TaxID=3032204 RepID=UPI0024A18BCD|nr:hypothetical protein [Actinomadura sp. NBRC 104425]GLZ11621.1 hypothetical protein Acsp04_18560 [Actinomadura sp. NBRC 104425]
MPSPPAALVTGDAHVPAVPGPPGWVSGSPGRRGVASGGAAGAAVLVTGDGHVPAGHSAVSVPAGFRPAPVPGERIAEAAEPYRGMAGRYRAGLCRIG